MSEITRRTRRPNVDDKKYLACTIGPGARPCPIDGAVPESYADAVERASRLAESWGTTSYYLGLIIAEEHMVPLLRSPATDHGGYLTNE